jgi:lathosterol oxidase
MDIILELWDTFIGDRLYSSVLPASLSSSVSLPAFANVANSSLALFGASEPFVYEPATQMLHLEPSKYAYLSAWPRNNMYRQFTSFFLITWYAPLPWFCKAGQTGSATFCYFVSLLHPQ